MLSKCKMNRFWLLLVLSELVIMSGCADIRLKPKDPELVSLGKFAEGVTKHLLVMSPSTYVEYQTALAEELAPTALSQLIAKGQCAKSREEAVKTAKTIEQNSQRCLVQIDSTSFPGKATSKIGR